MTQSRTCIFLYAQGQPVRYCAATWVVLEQRCTWQAQGCVREYLLQRQDARRRRSWALEEHVEGCDG